MAVVKVENKTYTVDPLYQWDKNQVLEIRGLSLAKVPEIHFTNTLMDRAVVRPASMDAAGIITTQVPNTLLQKASRITVYICNYEGSAFKTMYKVEIPVRARQMPGDYTFDDAAGEIYSFNALETQVANALTAATEAKGNYNKAAKDLAECKTLLEQATALYTSAEEKYSNALATLNGVEDGSVFLKKAGDEMAGTINMNGHTVTGLADPDGDTDAATKIYVDEKAGALPWTESAEHPGCYFRAVGDETEWLNPPMVKGGEYRTVERLAGKPVYVRVFEHMLKSAFTPGTGAELAITASIDPAADPFKVEAYMPSGELENGNPSYIVRPLPYHAADSALLAVSRVKNAAGALTVTLYGENVTVGYMATIKLVVYYTKEATG